MVGSFKIRGALYQFMHLTKEQCQKGVVAFSSGNHGQAVACVAQQYKTSALILMPDNVPDIKMRLTQGFGAEIDFYDHRNDNRERIAEEIVEKTGRTLIHPFHQPLTIAGQSTVGSDILDQAKQPHFVFVPCGGGGLAAGMASMFLHKGVYPEIGLAVPYDYLCKLTNSLCGENMPVPVRTGFELCDALLAPRLGSLNAEILNYYGQISAVFPPDAAISSHLVEDSSILGAMSIADQYFGTRLEPSGAAALAAAVNFLAGNHAPHSTIVVVGSGGNIDEDKYREHVARGRGLRHRLWHFDFG